MSTSTLDASTRLGVRLPPDARAPFEVFLDGIELMEGSDYDVLPGAIELRVAAEPRRESRWRDLVSTVVGIGFYRQGDFIDVCYSDGSGRTSTATLPVAELLPSAGSPVSAGRCALLC
jgi:hypothetical protein